jgi:hypothetical protein
MSLLLFFAPATWNGKTPAGILGNTAGTGMTGAAGTGIGAIGGKITAGWAGMIGGGFMMTGGLLRGFLLATVLRSVLRRLLPLFLGFAFFLPVRFSMVH